MAATNINVVVLTGNLTRDPELRSLPSGMSVCSLRIASNTRRKGQSGEWEDKANYFDVTVWGAQGENCARFLSKGRPVALNGRLEWREWQAQDGQKRQSVEIIADSVQFLGGRDEAPQRRRRVHPAVGRPGRQPRLPAGGRTCGRRQRPRGRRHPLLGVERLTLHEPAPEHASGAVFRSAGATVRGGFRPPPGRVAARLPQWTARAPQRARICAPPRRLVTRSTRKVFASGKAAQPADAPA